MYCVIVPGFPRCTPAWPSSCPRPAPSLWGAGYGYQRTEEIRQRYWDTGDTDTQTYIQCHEGPREGKRKKDFFCQRFWEWMLFLFRVDKLIVSSSVQYFRSLNPLQSRTNDHQLQGYCPVWGHNGVRVLVLLYTTRPSHWHREGHCAHNINPTFLLGSIKMLFPLSVLWRGNRICKTYTIQQGKLHRNFELWCLQLDLKKILL